MLNAFLTAYPLVLPKNEIVGHPSDVVANYAFRLLAGHLFLIALRKLFGMRQPKLEQLGN